MQGIFWGVVLPLVVWFALAVVFFYLLVFSCKRKEARCRSPLTRYLLRGPGETLRSRLAEVEAEVDFRFYLLFLLPVLVYALFVGGRQGGAGALLALLGCLVVFVAYLLYRLRQLLAVRCKFRLGLDCEVAVGQELNLLMRHGCSVFHDLPGEGFNIDHVLIGLAGVYAVETVGRSKPSPGRGQGDAHVAYNGKTLMFPLWEETAPIAQARLKAEWLAGWLAKVVGEPVPVKGIIVLPGWVVEASGRHEVSVINEKSAPFLVRPRDGKALAEEFVQRIAYQVEQRCRNVEPVGYRQGWKGCRASQGR